MRTNSNLQNVKTAQNIGNKMNDFIVQSNQQQLFTISKFEVVSRVYLIIYVLLIYKFILLAYLIMI